MKEIGTEVQKFPTKFKVAFSVTSGIFYAVILYLFHFLFDEVESLKSYIFSATFFGLFYGVGFLFVMQWIAKRMNKKVTVNPKLQENEEIQVYGPANYANSWMAVGGKLFITNSRLIFKSHKYNINRPQINIELDKIENIRLKSPLNLFDSMMIITDRTGKKYKFNVNEREVWLEHLKAYRSDLAIS